MRDSVLEIGRLAVLSAPMLLPDSTLAPKIYMMSLAAFVAMPTRVDKEKFVRDFRTRSMRGYYGSLRHFLRRCSYQPSDVQQKRATFLSRMRSTPSQKNLFAERLTAYLDVFQEIDATPQLVQQGTVTIANLPITVDPEVHVQLGGQAYILKVWLNREPPDLVVSTVVGDLVEWAMDDEVIWPRQGYPGILDVARRTILERHRLPRYGIDLEAECAEFLRLWRL